MAQFYVLKSEKQCTSVPKLMPFHTEEADDCCAAVHTFPGATSTCTILQPDTFKWWSLLQIEIARHGWSWEEFRRTDESFVFLLIDADILSCLLLPHLAELKPSNWHVASLRYADRHWCVHSLSLCIFPLLCLPLIWFLLTRVSAVRVPRSSSVPF